MTYFFTRNIPDGLDGLDDLGYLLWSTLICLGLLGLFQITIERLKCSKAISGRDGIGIGYGMEISVGTDSKSTALRC